MKTNNTLTFDSVTSNIEDSTDIQFAPIKGKDLRKNLPKHYFVRKPMVFLCKFILALLLIALSWYSVWYAITTRSFLAAAGGMILAGLMYAHLVELQHECVHSHAFKSSRLNRLFGVFAGLFMFSSFSYYRYDHLRHHAYLGTTSNQEHFDYRFNNLNSIKGFAIAFFDLHRYHSVFSTLGAVITGRWIKGVHNEKTQLHIKQEYAFYTIVFLLSIVASAYFHSWFFSLAWWLPSLSIAEGVHFMIEMPEHYGLNTQTLPDVFSNTRTICTNALVAWFVNGNHTHTAHHFHQGVPMCNVKQLNELIKPDLKVVETSYFAFFRDVINGRIKNSDTSCMVR